jgi:hypothetical protein
MQILSSPEIFGRLLYMISASSGQSLQLVTAIHTEDGGLSHCRGASKVLLQGFICNLIDMLLALD